MRIYFSQVYIEPGVNYPFSHVFQQRMSAAVSDLVQASENFIRKFGNDWKVIFNVSAKKEILAPEIVGPAVFKRTKDVEFTIFLPHDGTDANQLADYTKPIRHLLLGAIDVLEKLKLDPTELKKRIDSVVMELSSDPTMFKRRRNWN